MATKDLYSANNFHRMSFGDFGFRVLDKSGVDSITSVSGEYFCMIEAITTCTISLTNDVPSGDTTLTNYTLLDGQIIYGKFTDITLSGGHCIAYLRHVPQ